MNIVYTWPGDVEYLKKGNKIHIKKENKGKFTKSAKRAGMSVQQFAAHVLANKDKYDTTTIRRANFARNARKFKHQDGGTVEYHADLLPEVEVTANYPYEQRVINTMSSSNPEFIQRLRNNDRRAIRNNDGTYSTHLMSSAGNISFPVI